MMDFNGINIMSLTEFLNKLEQLDAPATPPTPTPTFTVVKVTDMNDPTETAFLMERYGIESYQAPQILSLIQAAQEYAAVARVNGPVEDGLAAIDRHNERLCDDTLNGLERHAAELSAPIAELDALMRMILNTRDTR